MPHKAADHTQAELIVFAFVFHAGKVLLIERANEPFKGQKTTPGGHKKLGETLREGCLREIQEETGLVLEELVYAGILHALPTQPGGQEYVSHYFVSHRYSGCLRDSAEGRLFWVPVEELLDPAKRPALLHPAFTALFPYVVGKQFPFEGSVTMDAAGEGDYRIFPAGC